MFNVFKLRSNPAGKGLQSHCWELQVVSLYGETVAKVFSSAASRCYGLRKKQRSKGGEETSEQEGPRGSPVHEPITSQPKQDQSRSPAHKLQLPCHEGKEQNEAPPTNSNLQPHRSK